MLEDAARDFAAIAPAVDYWAVRLVQDRVDGLSVRRDVPEPARCMREAGAMVTIMDRGGMGYGATCDLTREGLREAAAQARAWAHRAAGRSVVPAGQAARVSRHGEFRQQPEVPWDAWSLADKVDLLRQASGTMKVDPAIVDWFAMLMQRQSETLLVSSDGGHIQQAVCLLFASLRAVANRGSASQVRSHGEAHYRQGGLELLARLGFQQAGARLAGEALALLDAPPCPTGRRDLVLLPSQVVLQVHESIGHPLELDRILGDERNYAGGSFVTPDMFGQYRYGSPLLNITFDPDLPGEAASYRFDDEGTPATREHLIRDGILLRPLGGAVSQARSGLPGVACARASGWNRPPIDRMANVNLEPGSQTMAELIGAVQQGVLMETNRSWSIDDSRNKFQFGCELGRLIENGELRGLVRTPGYRGISATFWRSLAGVGDRGTFDVHGLPNCGKGEPNQAIHSGHAAPACLFRDVDVFGGE